MKRGRKVLRPLAIALAVFGCLAWGSAASAATITEDGKLLASDGAAADGFGFDLAMNGDRIIVGARGTPGDFDIGAAYLYEKDGSGKFTQIAKLVPTDADWFYLVGSSATIQGDTAVVCGYGSYLGELANVGAAWVFQKDAGGPNNWGQVAKLVASDAAAEDRFGVDVSIDGDNVIIGAFNVDVDGKSNAGAAYVFNRNQGGADAWGQVAKLTASDATAGATLGQSLGISGNTAVVGAYTANKAYIFEDDGTGNWTEKVILKVAGTTRLGTGTSIDGDLAVVGAYYTTVSGMSQAGSAYIFARDEGGPDAWGLIATLTASDVTASARFGNSATIDGDTVVIGANNLNSATGAAYVYRNAGAGTWIELAKLMASDGEASDGFGNRVGVSGLTAAVSATGDDDLGDGAGAAYVFTIPGVQPPPGPGDANRDGKVDDLDASILAANWLRTGDATWDQGDFNGDTDVNDLDASILAANWQSGVGAAVPEPATLVLLLTALSVWLPWRRGRKHP